MQAVTRRFIIATGRAVVGLGSVSVQINRFSTALPKTRMGLKHLSAADVRQYEEQGYLVVPGVLSSEDLAELRAAIDVFVARSSELQESTDVYKIEAGHSKATPQLGRVVCPSFHHEAFWKLQRHPKILDVIEDLLGDSFRYMPQDKLNMKLARVGSPIPWHQDWAFYPHTNDSLLAVCALMDDATTMNGCLQVVPGSHLGPLYNHSVGDVFASRICDDDFNTSGLVNLEARAGSITIHHARLAHGSLGNTSDASRRATCNVYCAADAWPLLGVAGRDFNNTGPVDWNVFCATMLRGKPNRFPRLKDVPVSLPLPLDELTGVFRA